MRVRFYVRVSRAAHRPPRLAARRGRTNRRKTRLELEHIVHPPRFRDLIGKPMPGERGRWCRRFIVKSILMNIVFPINCRILQIVFLVRDVFRWCRFATKFVHQTPQQEHKHRGDTSTNRGIFHFVRHGRGCYHHTRIGICECIFEPTIRRNLLFNRLFLLRDRLFGSIKRGNAGIVRRAIVRRRIIIIIIDLVIVIVILFIIVDIIVLLIVIIEPCCYRWCFERGKRLV